MIAEIKGKVNRLNTNLTALGEDELTGNFFGNMRAEMPEEITRKYRGVKRVVCKAVPLTDIRYENAYEMIFGTFKELKYK